MLRIDKILGIYLPTGQLFIHQGVDAFRAVGLLKFNATFTPDPGLSYGCIAWDDFFQCSTSEVATPLPALDLSTKFGDLPACAMNPEASDFAPLSHCICSYKRLDEECYAIQLHTSTNPFAKLAPLDGVITHTFLEMDYGRLSVSPMKLEEGLIQSQSIEDLITIQHQAIAA